MAQLMPLQLTVSCFSKIQIGLPFWYRLSRIVPEKGPLNGCVCACACVCFVLNHTVTGVISLLAWVTMASRSTTCTSTCQLIHHSATTMRSSTTARSLPITTFARTSEVSQQGASASIRLRLQLKPKDVNWFITLEHYSHYPLPGTKHKLNFENETELGVPC